MKFSNWAQLLRNIAVSAVAAGTLIAATPCSAGDWTRFRGSNGDGISQDSEETPVEWSAEKNLKWKVALPGPGSSCPIVVGDKVLVTCWSGYGTNQTRSASQSDLRRHLICVDRKTGDKIWSKSIEPVLPEDNYGGMFAEHGYASHTPVSDGERVYVFFGKTGVLAFDMDGKQIWQTNVGRGSDPRGWGSASSPVLYKNLVIVTASAESESLVGLDKISGKVIWKQEAAGLGSTWGTPVLVKVDDDRTDLVLGVPYEIWGLNPDNGKLRWYCEAMDTNSYCSSVVSNDGIVFGVEGRSGGSIAVKAGGKGDVSKSHVVWSGRDRGRIGTPLLIEGRLYFFSGGVANCLDARTGDRVYQARLESGGADTGNGSGGRGGSSRGGGFGGGRGGGQDYSSPVAADGKIYYVSRSGDMHVVRAGDKFEKLATNRVTSDREDFSSSPAISAGELFVRSSAHLYCISNEAE